MAGNVVYLCGLFRENAFGVPRRARQTQNTKNDFPLFMAKANASAILNRDLTIKENLL